MARIYSLVHLYLLSHEGIVIEELGALITSFKSAGYVAAQKRMLPPRKIITFSQKMKHRDNHFIEFIAARLNINTSKATEQYLSFCEAIRQDLKTKGEVTFPVAGKLVKKELLYQFEQTPGFTCYGPSLGHPGIKMQAPTIQQIPQTQKKKKKGTGKFIVWSAAAILLIAIGYTALFTEMLNPAKIFFVEFFNKSTKEESQKQEKIAGLTEASVDSLAAADSVTSYIVTHLDETTEPRKALYFETPAKDSSGPVHYFIIAGSFRQRHNARNFQRVLKEKGYKSQLMVSSKELYRIALDSFCSEDTALNVMARIRAKGDIESVWLLNASKKRQ